MKLRVGLSTAVVAAALLVACGDDDDEGPSKAEYVRQANPICAEWQRDFQRLFERGFPTTQSAVTRFFGEAAPLYRERMRKLRELDPPEADETRVNRFLAAGDRAVAEFERARNDPEFASRLFNQEGGRNERAFQRQASAYGLTRCVEEEEDTDEERVDPETFSAEKREFVERADARCRASDRRTTALEERYLREFPPPLSAWAEFLPRIVPIARSDLAYFRSLTPPAEDRAEIDRLLDRQEEFVDTLDRAARAARRRDEESVSRLTQQAFAGSEELDADLRQYGFQVCGQEDEDEGE